MPWGKIIYSVLYDFTIMPKIYCKIGNKYEIFEYKFAKYITRLFINLAALCHVCWFPSTGLRFREIIKTEGHTSKAKS
jgi:hypothetical protein